jgi:L-seryl-tRNA(Ser) seleniumtransferase
MPSIGVAVATSSGRGAADLLARLRAADPCVIGRIERDRVVLDLRTVTPTDDVLLASALTSAIGTLRGR